MAPYPKLTHKEIRLKQMPWVTQGLLVSMHVRDKLYKQLKLKKVTQRKAIYLGYINVTAT